MTRISRILGLGSPTPFGETPRRKELPLLAFSRVGAVIVASTAVLLLPAPGVRASQQCWAWKEVRSAHENQGDEILAMFRSWIKDGAYTVIYQDPADGVVTEVTVLGAGVACIYDVGKRISDYPISAAKHETDDETGR